MAVLRCKRGCFTNDFGLIMGRYAGSGRDTVEESRVIDISYLHRHHMLAPGYSSTLRWFRNEEQVAFINIRATGNAIVLSYRYRSGHGSDWQDVEQRVPLDWTECNYGGSRPWFRCDVSANGVHCGRRVAKLYGHGRLFACRHCYDLAHESQRENWGFRAVRKAQKLRECLGANIALDGFPPDKPKGMHWSTYERLSAQLTEAEMTTDAYGRFLGGR
jgi:hypothetical protein